MRIIKNSEFSKQSHSRFIVCMGSFLSRAKVFEKDAFTMSPNSGTPLLFAHRVWIKIYALKAASIVALLPMVSRILSPRALPQILAAVIKRISVFVIGFFSGKTTENNAVHLYRYSMAACSIKALCKLGPLSVPVPLREPFKVLDIDNGILPLRERNKSVRLVEWLSNRVPLKSVLWHESSAKGFVLLSHFSMLLAAIVLFSCAARAQNALVPVPPVFLGPSTAPRLGANLTITFCTSTATGAPCSPLAQAYADSTNSNPINQSINPLKTDALGNAPVFYAAPGQYSFTVTGPGVGTPQGPYQITVSCIPGTTCVAAGANNAFTGNNTHSGTETFTGGLTAATIGGDWSVDGAKYALTAAGIQSAINDASSAGGGRVKIASGTINVTNTVISIPSSVCVEGAGKDQTILRYSGTPNPGAFSVAAGVTKACLKGLTVSFATAANAVGLRIQGNATGSLATQFNLFRDLHFIHDGIASTADGSQGINATGTGAPLDISANTFDNIIVENMSQGFICAHCEGNWWWNVQTINVGGGSVIMFAESDNNDEVIQARVETGSANGTGNTCYSAGGHNNFVRLVCDSHFTTNAINDTGTLNHFEISVIPDISGPLGTLAASSSALYVQALGGVQQWFFGNGNGAFVEGTPAGAAANSDVIAADSTAHCLKGSWNNGAFLCLVQELSTTGSVGGSSVAGGTCTDTAFALAGATTSMAVIASPQGALGSNWSAFSWSALVSSAGNVSVHICNVSAGALTPAALTFTVKAIQ